MIKSMPVQIIHGDIFTSRASTLVNPINCVGVMGKGLAHQFKRRYPDMYADYMARYRLFRLNKREPYIYYGRIDKQAVLPNIICFPTKDHWREDSRLEDIEAGLAFMSGKLFSWAVGSLALPALGCGCGNLAWADVRPLIDKYLGAVDIPVTVYVLRD